jgi:hypothetical protein
MLRVLFLLSLAVVISCNKDLPEEPPAGNSTNTNKPPVANAGPDRSITLPDTSYVLLDGTGSYDPEKLLLTYKWTQLSGPQTLFFSDSYGRPGESFASFANSGTYLFQLTVTDGRNAVYDTVEINVKWAVDCNPNREMVSAETVGLGIIPMKGSYAPSYAVGPNQLVLAGGHSTNPWLKDPSNLFFCTSL